MRIGFQRSFPAVVGDVHDMRQGDVVQRVGAGPGDGAGHVGDAIVDDAIDDVLTNYANGRLIFNLGHGIQPETPIAHVGQMVKRVRDYR